MKSITLGYGTMKHRYFITETPIGGFIEGPQSERDRESKKRELYVDERSKGQRLHLNHCIHESIHAVNPFLEEYEVVRIAESAARLLWGLGYRCE